MKPIGIGKLSKASPKSARPLSRYELEMPKPITLTSAPEEPILKEEIEGELSVDVYQTDHEIVIMAPVAGTTAEDLNISITDDVITIKGRRQKNSKDTIKDNHYYIQECFWGKFSRSIILPAEVDTTKVDARFKNSILTVRIPKIEQVRTRLIRIKEE